MATSSRSCYLRENNVTISKISRSGPLRQIIVVYCEKHMLHIDTECKENGETLFLYLDISIVTTRL